MSQVETSYRVEGTAALQIQRGFSNVHAARIIEFPQCASCNCEVMQRPHATMRSAVMRDILEEIKGKPLGILTPAQTVAAFALCSAIAACTLVL